MTKDRIIRALITAILAMLIAGSATRVILLGMGIPCTVWEAWLPALILALLCGLGSLSRGTGILAAAGGVLLAAGFVLSHRAMLPAFIGTVRDMIQGVQVVDELDYAHAAHLFAPLLSAVMGLFMFAFVRHSGGVPFAILVFFSMMMVAWALNPDLSFLPAAPGLIGCVAAFALSGALRRDAGAWRALAAAVLAVLLAFSWVPQGHPTWAPLAQVAARARAVFEDYFQFTEERIPFTITTEGFNHAVQDQGDVVSRLGGPAVPSRQTVMEVQSSHRVLLRGAIRRVYTGSSWIDPDAKARYLYYDLLRRDEREQVLGMKDNEAFEPLQVSVRFVTPSTSALFVPSRLEAFHMDLQNAVYFNSIGEMFLSRLAERDDRYQLEGAVVGQDDAALRALIAHHASDADEGDADLLNNCLQLPEGIEGGVYDLAAQLTEGLENPYDRAKAIEQWLKANCRYTLEPEMPDEDRDFVSEFVLTTREGYCSYFASAMTVMCRMAGLPARYVEGYAVEPSQTPVAVTGEDAHAWTEVWFKGVGWISFDPSNGGDGGEEGDGGSGQDEGAQDPDEQQDGSDPSEAAPPTPTPTPPPEEAPNDGAGNAGQATPTPPPMAPEAATTPPPEPDPDPHRDHPWWWLLLILLVLLALALAVHLRLKRTDALRLSRREKAPGRAALILYRAMLTLLQARGIAPASGETPGQFARRVTREKANPAFVGFADRVAAGAYADRPLDLDAVEAGRQAYRAMLGELTARERLRFGWRRIWRGLGSFEQIP